MNDNLTNSPTYNDPDPFESADQRFPPAENFAGLENRLPREPTGQKLWRPSQAREVTAHLLRPNPPIVSITGKPGSGRTTLISDAEQVIRRADERPTFIRFRPDSDSVAELQTDLRHLASTDGWRAKELIVIDDLDEVARLGTRGPGVELLDLISLAHHRDHVPFLVTIDQAQLDRLADVHEELAATLHHIHLLELPAADLRAIIDSAAADLARRARVNLALGVTEAALAPSAPKDARAQPGLALSRIDAAIGRARISGSATVEAKHLRHAYDADVPLVDLPAPATVAELTERLTESVRGQDAAITTFATRLAPAFAGLKLRPERPHGIFLFAGPSGVGKTELAKRTAEVAYGSADALIRLDMSEYGNGQDGRVKLIGAHRSWKNSSTDGLLTTRVIEKPRSVVLFDEFEKSSPEVWPLFLQIFDEGRLKDGWDQTASFAETVIILTSNLGVREATTRSAGFGATDEFNADRQLGAITKALPPELMNRLTAVIPFAPLAADTIGELAELELTRAARRFAENGWRIQWAPDVVDWIAGRGYDPAYGARHLQRAVERDLFPLLAASPGRAVRLRVRDGNLQATA